MAALRIDVDACQKQGKPSLELLTITDQTYQTMYIQIFFALSQFTFLSQAINSKSSKIEAFIWTIFFAIIHVFSGYITYPNNEYNTIFVGHTFVSSIVLPVILGSVLRLLLVAISTTKPVVSRAKPVVQASSHTADISQLELVILDLETYLKEIKRQKEQIVTSSGQNIKSILTSIESKLAHLHKRIDLEVGKNEAMLNRLRFIPNEKNRVTSNLNALHKLQIDKNSFLRIFQIEKPHLLAKSVGKQISVTSRQPKRVTIQPKKVVVQPKQQVSDVPISQRLSQIEDEVKTIQNGLMNLKQANKDISEIRQFVKVTPQVIHQLNETIEDCLFDVKITCHPTTAKARNKQLNELSEQLKQFTLDFEGFTKNLNFTTVLEASQAILPHQKVHILPKLEAQAQILWQDYHPESEEVFWELYNELLQHVKILS